jgi:adenosylcobinamide-phosphate synthase
MESIYRFVAPLIIGYILDLLLGDPEKMPHPVRLFGNLISAGEKRLNTENYRFLKGLFLSIALIGSTYLTFYLAEKFVFSYNDYIYIACTSLFVYFGVANRCLIDEGRNIFRKLKIDLPTARTQLSRIVGRETKNLSDQQIKIAVFETMSENLSDGVIAPLFYYAIGGVPAMMAYKMINTLDSMIAYRSPRYEQFGKFAARLDDVANYIPARLTALFISLVTLSKRAIYYTFIYGRLHKSPNAGYPEAALAGALDCRFGGNNYYHGILVEKPYIGTNPRNIEDREINMVIYINHAVTFLSIAIIVLLNFVLMST